MEQSTSPGRAVAGMTHMVEFSVPGAQSRNHRIRLSAEEARVARHLLALLLEGQLLPTLEKMADDLSLTADKMSEVFESLRKKDLLILAGGTGTVVGAYPVSVQPTQHEIVLENGAQIFAMCAMDALSIPGMVGMSATVRSRCEWCRKGLTINIDQGQLVSRGHRTIRVWSPTHWGYPAATTCCPDVNFFCCPEHVQEWERKNRHSGQSSRTMTIEQAFSEAKDHWKGYGEALELRL